MYFRNGLLSSDSRRRPGRQNRFREDRRARRERRIQERCRRNPNRRKSRKSYILLFRYISLEIQTDNSIT